MKKPSKKPEGQKSHKFTRSFLGRRYPYACVSARTYCLRHSLNDLFYIITNMQVLSTTFFKSQRIRLHRSISPAKYCAYIPECVLSPLRPRSWSCNYAALPE